MSTYNVQGILERFVEIGQTATTIEVYHPDGWLELRRIEYVDHFREDVYQADGVLLSEENSELGIKYVYDMAGNKIEAYDVDNYGRRTHVFWLSDGTAVIYVHEFNGSVTKSVQEANNGSVISEIQNYTGPETADIGTIVPPVAKQSE